MFSALQRLASAKQAAGGSQGGGGGEDGEGGAEWGGAVSARAGGFASLFGSDGRMSLPQSLHRWGAPPTPALMCPSDVRPCGTIWRQAAPLFRPHARS
jgi:hypothetical protein